MNGLAQVLKIAWNIVIMDNTNNQTIRLQALSLINDCYKYQMDLTTNGIIITNAIKYVQGKMDHLNNQAKKLLQDIKEDAEIVPHQEEDSEQQQQQTTIGVF